MWDSLWMGECPLSLYTPLVEQTVFIFVFSLKFCILHCCLASIPNPKILTFFRIRKVAHVQKTFFDWQTHSAVRYCWLEPNPIYRIEFGERLENIQPVCCTDKFHTQKRAHLRPVTLKKKNLNKLYAEKLLCNIKKELHIYCLPPLVVTTLEQTNVIF